MPAPMRRQPIRTPRTDAGAGAATARTTRTAATAARPAPGTHRTRRWARPARESTVRSSVAAQDDERAVTEVAPSGDTADLRARDLGGARVAAQLADGLDDVVHAPHVALREQPAVRVRRQGTAVEPERTIAYE